MRPKTVLCPDIQKIERRLMIFNHPYEILFLRVSSTVVWGWGIHTLHYEEKSGGGC